MVCSPQKTTINNGTTTTIWKHQYPIPSYLIAFAVAQYEEYHQTVKIGETEMPVLNYIYPGKTPDNYKEIKKTLDEVPGYITRLSDLLGEYPFKNEKYGHAEWDEWGSAMEHTTVTFMTSFWPKHIIIHELAHQWFGNQVTCATWSDIWINEGFATFIESLMGYDSGIEDYEYRYGLINNYLLYSADSGSVYNPEPDNPDRTFNPLLSYSKAGMVVYQLKNYVGNDAFYAAVRNFLKEKQFQFVTTEDLKQSLSNFTGVDLTEYFNDWIYGEGYPVFDLSVTRNNINDVLFSVNQTQTHSSVSFFETPFKVEFIGDNGQSVIKKFDLTHNHQTFHITDLPFTVKDMKFNPLAEIIAKENQVTVDNEIIQTEDFINIKLNPAARLISVSSQEAIKGIQIFDLSGQLIQAVKGGDIFYSVSTVGWSQGVYLINVDSPKGAISQKISIF